MWIGITALALIYLIAIWAIVTGVAEIVVAVQLRQATNNTWLLLINGILSIILGLVLFFWPVAGALTLVRVIGVYAIIFGIVLLVLAFRARRQQPVVGMPV